MPSTPTASVCFLRETPYYKVKSWKPGFEIGSSSSLTLSVFDQSSRFRSSLVTFSPNGLLPVNATRLFVVIKRSIWICSDRNLFSDYSKSIWPIISSLAFISRYAIGHR